MSSETRTPDNSKEDEDICPICGLAFEDALYPCDCGFNGVEDE
jgi:hypothetical protein